MPGKKDAAYYREYRKRRAAAGNTVASGRYASKFDRAQFIAWDGEGITDDDCSIDEFTNDHRFVLLANSIGETLSVRSGRIATRDAFDMLLRTASNHPRAIHVLYGGSYDMNHILRDLPQDKVKELAKHGDVEWRGYYIKFLPRKSLFIQRGETSITLWDVIGFFQMSFVQAIEQWLGKDYVDLPLIREGKKQRTAFENAQMEFMQEYNNAELRALVALMEKFHFSVSALGLKLARWDGAGAVAAAILTKKDFKRHLTSLNPKPGQKRHPIEVEKAGTHAYFGGRFELGAYGVFDGPCYGYDINSAYPTVFRDMPSLSQGTWREIDNPTIHDITDFSLVRVRWNLPGIRFGPFPYRDIHGLVLYPDSGWNWVWGCEVKAYFDWSPDRPDYECILEKAWIFEPFNNERPFTWIQDYYDERQRIVNGESNLPFGCQMVIKLGLNSLYGKTAQNLGYQEDSRRLPPYYSILYAGFITAATRAKLWRAAMYNPESVVMLATDGIIATQELNVPISEQKVLGMWERTEYNYVLAIQSGVYITRKGDKLNFRKRGIDTQNQNESIQAFIDKVLKHWGNRRNIYKKMPVPQSRLIGIKSAAVSDVFFRRWGCWYNASHDLMMQPGPQTKRVPDPNSPNHYPRKGLVLTVPTENFIYELQGYMSTPYERPWDREGWLWTDPEELQEMLDGEYA